MKISKNRKAVIGKVEVDKAYGIDEATKLLKDITTTKFDASVDLQIRLGVDPTKADQAIRGTVSLPNGTGKDKTVLVLCEEANEKEAKGAGADYVGLAEYMEKIEKGWTDIDVVIATPSVMPKIARLGRVLGPRNLMPNPKSGTVTDDLAKAIKDVKGGKIAFKVDKFGIISTAVGRASFDSQKNSENAMELLKELVKLKPSSSKGAYFKSVYLSSTMSPSILINTKELI